MSRQNKSVIENRRNPSSKPASNKQSNTKKRQSANSGERIKTTKPKTSQKKVRPKKAKRKPGFLKKFFKSFFLVLLVLAISGFLINFFFLRNVNAGLSGNIRQYGISSSAAEYAKNHKIVNIAVFGIDGRDDVEGDRTDTIMIATADYEHNQIKVTSLMRDTYAYIDDDYEFDKLNAAYAYGGADLAIKTINQNFDTAITDYVTIDFTSMVTIVNAVGGVTIDIETDDELYWVNAYLDDVNEKVETGSPHLEDTGSQLVDGSQALAYCRVRYVGDGDFDRTLRQRVVFEQALSKALSLSPKEQYNLLMDLMPYIETSLSTSEFIKYGLNTILMTSRNISQSRFPSDDALLLDYIWGSSFVIPDTLEDNIKELYEFIYEDASYTPSSQALEISNMIDAEVNGTSYSDSYEDDEDNYDNDYDSYEDSPDSYNDDYDSSNSYYDDYNTSEDSGNSYSGPPDWKDSEDNY